MDRYSALAVVCVCVCVRVAVRECVWFFSSGVQLSRPKKAEVKHMYSEGQRLVRGMYTQSAMTHSIA